VFFVLNFGKVGSSKDVGQNGAFESTLAWFFPPTSFKVEVVLQQQFVP
jgi:hypothetical protein